MKQTLMILYIISKVILLEKNHNFENEIKIFEKIKSGYKKLELRGRHKSEEQKSALKILNCFTKHEKLP